MTSTFLSQHDYKLDGKTLAPGLDLTDFNSSFPAETVPPGSLPSNLHYILPMKSEMRKRNFSCSALCKGECCKEAELS